MSVKESDIQSENKKYNDIHNSKEDIKDEEKKKVEIMAINEKYQKFISIIFFSIGCSFLFYLYSFVFSAYVSIQIFNF